MVEATENGPVCDGVAGAIKKQADNLTKSGQVMIRNMLWNNISGRHQDDHPGGFRAEHSLIDGAGLTLRSCSFSVDDYTLEVVEFSYPG